MKISVQGEQRVKVAPERAELYLAASGEHTDRAKVIADVTATANQLGRELEELKQAGAVERYTVQPLRTWAVRKGRSRVEQITATVELTADFADFEALGRFTSDVSGRDGVRLAWVRWRLTDATADRLRDECIAGAVERARQRAEAMARAAGAGTIEIVEIADPGLLGNPEPQVPLARPMMARGAMASPMADESESVQIVPQEIEIGAQLQLRFDTVD